MKKIIPVFLSVFLSGMVFFSAMAEEGRYFHEGDGFISIANKHNNQRASVRYRNKDGIYNKNGINRINAVFGMPSKKTGEDVSLRLISMLDHLEDRFSKGKTLILLSGFRTERQNGRLKRASRTSLHLEGMAADVIFPDAEPAEIWEYVKSLNCCGAGYYHGKAVHVDSGRPRFWTSVGPPGKKGRIENRYISLSIDKDIYYRGEPMRLFLSGISNYPFGVRPNFKLMREDKKILSFKPDFYSNNGNSACRPIRKRKDARFIYWNIPKDVPFPEGMLNVKVGFCGHQFKNMPREITSRPFKIKTH